MKMNSVIQLQVEVEALEASYKQALIDKTMFVQDIEAISNAYAYASSWLDACVTEQLTPYTDPD